MMEVGFDIQDYEASARRYLEGVKRERERLVTVSRDTYSQRLADAAPDMLETLRYLLESGELGPEAESVVRNTLAPFMEDW